MLLPAIAVQASQDDRLTRRDLKVYYLLFTCLDTLSYRYAKLVWLESRTRLKQPNISSCLSKLATLGYIVRGPDEPEERGGHPRRTYRLAASLPPGSDLSPAITQKTA